MVEHQEYPSVTVRSVPRHLITARINNGFLGVEYNDVHTAAYAFPVSGDEPMLSNAPKMARHLASRLVASIVSRIDEVSGPVTLVPWEEIRWTDNEGAVTVTDTLRVVPSDEDPYRPVSLILGRAEHRCDATTDGAEVTSTTELTVDWTDDLWSGGLAALADAAASYASHSDSPMI